MRSGSQDRSVDVFVEIPRGSRTKHELDQNTCCIRLDRFLFSSVHHPADHGLVIDTIGGDGDTLDVLDVVEEPTFPGCVVPWRPIGTLRMRDAHRDDDKNARRTGQRSTVRRGQGAWRPRKALASRDRVVLRHYGKPESNKSADVKGWHDADVAWKLIGDARAPATGTA